MEEARYAPEHAGTWIAESESDEGPLDGSFGVDEDVPVEDDLDKVYVSWGRILLLIVPEGESPCPRVWAAGELLAFPRSWGKKRECAVCVCGWLGEG